MWKPAVIRLEGPALREHPECFWPLCPHDQEFLGDVDSITLLVIPNPAEMPGLS